ncbi:MAG: class I SAM-dependent methyltransferase [Candidatus Eremiobacteraeota bacterium]|nr:class I SAM-dependent methyltransferase [Candidatus Eremiobacteraeota bacterium]
MSDAASRYLELLKACLMDEIYDPEHRDVLAEDREWPRRAHTMLGRERLDNIQACIESVLEDGVEGDLIETGVWRGGATIFMRGVLEARGDAARTVWVADSFQGLPAPDTQNFPADAADAHFTRPELAVSVDEVKANFARYGLLDDRVIFVEGWFRETLPALPVEKLAVLRLDGDMYESTRVALDALYPKLQPGGYIIVDDYRSIPGCFKAVNDYRAEQHIREPFVVVDWTAVCWRREPNG